MDIFVKARGMLLHSDCAVDVYLFQTFTEDLTKNITYVRKAEWEQLSHIKMFYKEKGWQLKRLSEI